MGTVELLLLDDDLENVRQLREILQDVQISTRLNVVNCLEEARDFLRRKGSFSESPQVDLILLNFGVLARYRNSTLREIGRCSAPGVTPVMILDLPAEPRDLLKFRLYISILHAIRSRFSQDTTREPVFEPRTVAAGAAALV